MAKPEYRAEIPKPLLIGAGIMMVTAMVFAAVAKRMPEEAGQQTIKSELLAAEAAGDSRRLRFEHRPDGSMLVLDAADESQIATFAPGANGFVRMVVRSMVNERRLSGADYDAAFHLQRRINGKLMIADPATGRTISLASYRGEIAQSFEELMTSSVSDKR
ncbi:MAG: photosynthetic complex assembly protein PuhC [Pseudomonadota bacterium]